MVPFGYPHPHSFIAVRLIPLEIHREFAASPVNAILNHPAVFPSISIPGQDPFDVSASILDPRNYFLCVPGGCVIFLPDVPGSGLYEVHTNFMPGHRGFHAVRASLQAYRWMFARTDCMMLQTRVPAFNEGAERFCEAVGASLWFERKQAWPGPDGLVGMKYYTLSYMDWVKRHGKPLVAVGRRFHDKLEHERERLGHPAPQGHPDDECHDLHVGACIEMIYGGMPEKGVQLYNRWARFAGYGQIGLIQREPLVIDICDAVLLVERGDFKAMTCRQ